MADESRIRWQVGERRASRPRHGREPSRQCTDLVRREARLMSSTLIWYRNSGRVLIRRAKWENGLFLMEPEVADYLNWLAVLIDRGHISKLCPNVCTTI